MAVLKGKFEIDDVTQQLVGSLLVGGPFIVTEEVWNIARSMSSVNVALTFIIVFVIGYGILYVAVLRDPERELSLAGVVPIRLISLVFIAYASTAVIAVVTGAAAFFTEGHSLTSTLWLTFKASTTVSIFTVIGAGTVDSVFGETVSPD